MRVLIADTLPPAVLDALAADGFELHVDAALQDDSLAAALADLRPEVLIVRSTKVHAAMLAGSLSLVVRAGAGVNTIDVAAASSHGVYVANCPGKNSLAVAELAIGFLVALDRRIPDAVQDLRSGRWSKAEFSRARGLAGRRLGIVGGGQIGLAVAARARALEMRVSVWNYEDSVRADVKALGARFEPDLHAMLGRCDAVSLHLAENPATKHLANRAFFEALPEGAHFINTSRAGIVDEEALSWALDHRGLRAGLDVFEGEGSGGSGTVDAAILGHPRVIATPHIGASTDQAQEAVAVEATRIVRAYRATGLVPNVVNVTQATPSSYLLVVRHRNRVGVLSHVFAELKDASINAAETENVVFSGGEACIARIAIDSEPSPDALERIQSGNPDVLALTLVPLTRRSP